MTKNILPSFKNIFQFFIKTHKNKTLLSTKLKFILNTNILLIVIKIISFYLKI